MAETPSEKKSDEKSVELNNRRSVKNILVKPRQQLKYAFFVFGAGLFMLVGFLTLFVSTIGQTMHTFGSIYGIERTLIEQVSRPLTVTLLIMVGFSAFLGVLAFVCGVVASHRLFGPMVPIMRQIENLRQGNYSARGKLRDKDEFHELMGALNDLAGELESRHGGSTPSGQKISQ